MRVLYGVCGEGFGHSSRAKEIITYLKKQGHTVLIITYGQAYPVLKKLSKTIKVKGIFLHYKDNKLSLQKTFSKNYSDIIHNIKNWKKIKKKIDKFSPNICISDMEIIVPIVSFWYKLPLISIDNQHRITHLKLNIPKKYSYSYNLAKIAINRVISKAEAYIILSYTKQKLIKKNVFIISPILREEIINLKPKTKDFILVYLTKPKPELIRLLKKIPEKFIFYSHNIRPSIKDNIEFKSINPNFIKDLANCKAIIGTAGFTLISESLYLKKPYFAIPLQGQFEQTLNSLFLKNSKLGTYSDNLTKEDVTEFIKNIPKYRKKLKEHSLNPNEIFPLINRLIKKNLNL